MKALSSFALAQQGDHHAIATVLNKYLQTKGYRVDATKHRRGLCLTVEGDEVPPQTNIVAFVTRRLKKIDPQGLNRITIRGRAKGYKITWRERLQLATLAEVTPLETGKKVIYRHRPGEVRGIGGGLLLTLITVIAGIGLWQTHQPQRAPWEYHLARVDAILLEPTLREFGAQGWELGDAPRQLLLSDQNQTIYEVIFKRPSVLAQEDADSLVLSLQKPYQLPIGSDSAARISPDTGYYPLPYDASNELVNRTFANHIRYKTLNEKGETVMRSGTLISGRTVEENRDDESEPSAPPLTPPTLPVPNAPIP